MRCAKHHIPARSLRMTVSVLIVFGLVSSLLYGCSDRNKTATFYAMGGIPVHIIASGVSEKWMDNEAERAKQSVEAWEAELSLYRPDSAVNRISEAVDTPVVFSEKGWEAVYFASQMEILTGGAFDVTVGPIIKVWKAAETDNRLPDPEAIGRAVSVTGFEHLILDPETRSVQRRPDTAGDAERSEIRLDVGGFAKGMFAQWLLTDAVESAESAGESIRKLLIDIGGDMYVYSASPDVPCRVGIRDPFSKDPSALWGIVEIDRGAVVTSGTYERHFMVEGQRYCHIVDPRTGRPIDTDIVSVSIVDPSGAVADALATAVFVMGEARGRRLVASRSATEMVIIREDGSYYVSEGLENQLEIFKSAK